MNLVLKLLGGLVALIVVLVALAVAWPFWPVAVDRVGGDAHRIWIEDHLTALDFTQADAGLSFDAPTYDARLVILSELHGFRAVQALDLAMLVHLSRNGPARTYLAEIGPDQALAFNHYLETGDETEVRDVFDAWARTGAQWANQEFFAKLQAIRGLNVDLPEARQIRFVGVDAVGDSDRLARLGASVDAALEPGFETYDQVMALNARLGALALDRPETASRYTHILGNIDALTQLDPERHFYGLWGLFHGAKTTVNGSQPLAMRLGAEAGAFAGSVVSISTLCIDECFNMMPAAALPSFLTADTGADYLYLPINFDDILLQRVRGVNDVKAAMGDLDAALFPLSGAQSPYAQGVRLSAFSGYLAAAQPFVYGGAAAQISDHMVVLRGSAGLTPWTGAAHDVTGGGAAEAGIPGVAAALGRT